MVHGPSFITLINIRGNLETSVILNKTVSLEKQGIENAVHSRPGYYLTFTTYMHEYHSSNKTDALAVPCVAVGHSVGMEHPPQDELTAMLLGAGKVRMGGKSTTCIISCKGQRK